MKMDIRENSYFDRTTHQNSSTNCFLNGDKFLSSSHTDTITSNPHPHAAAATTGNRATIEL